MYKYALIMSSYQCLQFNSSIIRDLFDQYLEYSLSCKADVIFPECRYSSPTQVFTPCTGPHPCKSIPPATLGFCFPMPEPCPSHVAPTRPVWAVTSQSRALFAGTTASSCYCFDILLWASMTLPSSSISMGTSLTLSYEISFRIELFKKRGERKNLKLLSNAHSVFCVGKKNVVSGEEKDLLNLV